MVSSELRDVLRLRAERLAAPLLPDDDLEQAGMVVAQFPIGDAQYALPLFDLRAALPLRGVTPVPLAPAHVIGVLRWEGRAITAVSLASLLGIRGWRRDPAMLLVVTYARRLVAIDSETIPRLGVLSRSAIDVGRARCDGPIVEIASAGGDLVNLLDIDRVLASKGFANKGSG